MTNSEWILMLLLIHNTLNYTSFLQTLFVYTVMYVPTFYFVAIAQDGAKFNVHTGEPITSNLDWK